LLPETIGRLATIDTIVAIKEASGHPLRAMSIADAAGNIVCNAEGVCEGRIAVEPLGSGGFGYDPIFVPDGFDRSFGELPPEVKAEVSHRAKATRLAVRYLQGFFDVLT
ncbi:MAG TPA: non-canonical purine NTP pyrophosphatase, partial [Pyrinomonadaceae bacterium]|nr:non-canonical purine NTP pyrophosphatase [Pyrinomonadaceae bacterium]